MGWRSAVHPLCSTVAAVTAVTMGRATVPRRSYTAPTGTVHRWPSFRGDDAGCLLACLAFLACAVATLLKLFTVSRFGALLHHWLDLFPVSFGTLVRPFSKLLAASVGALLRPFFEGLLRSPVTSCVPFRIYLQVLLSLTFLDRTNNEILDTPFGWGPSLYNKDSLK
jgi:hypothetical protein